MSTVAAINYSETPLLDNVVSNLSLGQSHTTYMTNSIDKLHRNNSPKFIKIFEALINSRVELNFKSVEKIKNPEWTAIENVADNSKSIFNLISLLTRKDFNEQLISIDFPSLFNGEIKIALLVMEILATTKLVPDIYKSKNEDTVMEYVMDSSRVSLVFNSDYCQVMALINGNVLDKFFVEDDYSIPLICRYTNELIKTAH